MEGEIIHYLDLEVFFSKSFSIRFAQIGVVSYGPSHGPICANPDKPGVYARVSDETLEWIKDTASGTQKSTCDNPIEIGVYVIPK